jgi:hypothetical protein
MTDRFGFFAAMLALGAAVAYGVPQILQVMGLLPTPLDLILIFAPSLLLAPAFVATMAAIHVQAPADANVGSLTGLAFAILYAALVGSVYVVQLGAVIPTILAGTPDRYALFACCAPGAPLTMVDLLGYTLMSCATLLAAPALRGDRLERAARLFMVLNGALAPFLFFQILWPWLIWVGALWLITFPTAMFLVMVVFARRVARAAPANR